MSNTTGRMESSITRRVLVCVALLIYPTWFMGPALLPWGHVLFQQSTRQDTSGTAFAAQMLKQMRLPWSKNMLSNAPYGTNFWSLPDINHGIHNIYFWLLTRWTSAEFTVSSFIWIGWCLSGVAAYLLARRLGSNRFGALFAGIICEMLPWMREKAMTHVSYVYFCIPLFAALLTLDFVKQPNKKNLAKLLCFQFLLIFFDLYWFFFVALEIFILLSLSISSLKTKYTIVKNKYKWIIFFSSIFTLVVFVLGVILVRVLMSEYFPAYRNLDISSLTFIDQFNGTLGDYVRPPPWHLVSSWQFQFSGSLEDHINYVGLTVLVLAVASIFSGIRKENSQKEILKVGVVVALFVLLTIRSSVLILDFKINNPLTFIRFLMPGVRVFSRAGIVAEALLAVLSGITVSRLIQNRKNLFNRLIIFVVLLFLAIVDLNPIRGREFTDAFSEFKVLRSALDSGSAYFQISAITDRFDGIPANALQAPMWGDPRDLGLKTELIASSQMGSNNFARCLTNRGLTHLVVLRDSSGENKWRQKWGNLPSVEIDLAEPVYKLVASTNGNQIYDLYKVAQFRDKSSCETPPLLSFEWSGVRPTLLPTWSIDKLVYEDGPDVGWVFGNESPSIRIKSNYDGIYDLSLSLVPAFGQYASTQIVVFQVNGVGKSVVLNPGSETTVTLQVSSNDLVSFRSIMPCITPSRVIVNNTDTRSLCFGITKIHYNIGK